MLGKFCEYEDNNCSHSNTHPYTYDNSGRLIREYLTEYDTQANKTTREFIYLYDETGMIGVMCNSIVYYYLRNLQGDVIAIYDASGEKKVEYAYDAWGNCTIVYAEDLAFANANPIRYRGYYFDRETGLYYLNARYYSPEWRRFISPDDTEYLDPETPNGLNLYAYCGNDPVNYADPSGHSVILISLIIGAAIGFGTAAYIDYQDDGQIFNGSVKWYDYLGATVLGGAIGAGLGAFAGMSFSASIPTFGWINTGGALMFGITGTTTLTITGAQLLGATGLLGATYMFASNNRPGNNRVQNKQFEHAARSAGYNPKDPRVKDILKEIHQYIRKNNLNLGWKELLELIKEWLG